MATPIQALVVRLAAFGRAVLATLQFLPHAALALLFVAIGLHWFGFDDPAQTFGAAAFFVLVLAVVLRREPT